MCSKCLGLSGFSYREKLRIKEVDQTAVKQEARSGGKQKVSFILKLSTKTKSRQNRDERQSSNQEQQDKVQTKGQSTNQRQSSNQKLQNAKLKSKNTYRGEKGTDRSMNADRG